MTALAWPDPNGTVFDATLWTTQTIANGGGAGSDTFQTQSAKGRVACVAGFTNSKQHAKYIHTNGQHSSTFDYRGLITWSAVGGEATNFIVRSTNVVVADSNYHTNCYIFEFDNTVNTLKCYKVVASVATDITGAPADASFTPVATTQYNVHFSLVNYTLAVTVWTGSEPGTPTYTVTDPDLSISSSTVGGWAWSNFHVPATLTNIDIGPATFTSNFDTIPGRRPVFRRF